MVMTGSRLLRKHMVPLYRAVGDSLGTGGTDKVHRVVVEHGGTSLFGENGEATVDQAHDRQNQMPEEINQISSIEYPVHPVGQVQHVICTVRMQSGCRKPSEVLLIG